MQNIMIDLVLCGIVYATLLVFIVVRELQKRRKDSDEGNDDDGGIPVSQPPDIDLPPGVCLPDDATRKTKSEPEEAFA